MKSLADRLCAYSEPQNNGQSFDERIKDLSPKEQEAVKRFWRSLVMRSQRAFSEENGRLLQCSNVRSCNCCPYGYHIDLDFVRYCESLANAKPSEEELQRRSRRRSRKSMEFMLGLDNIFDQWDAAERVPEAPHESEPESPHQIGLTTSTPYNGQQQLQRPRSSSVPRFSYGITRSESPFGTASSTCSSIRGAESDAAAATYTRQRSAIANGKQETRAFLRDALDDVCSDFERTLERTSMKRKKLINTNNDSAVGSGMCISFGAMADRNNNSNSSYKMSNGYGSLDKRTCQTWERYFDTFDSCVARNKSPRNSRVYSRSNTLPFQQKLSPAELQYESYVQATVAANAKSPVEVVSPTKPASSPAPSPSPSTSSPPPPPPRRHTQQSKIASPASESAKSPFSDKPTQSSPQSPLGGPANADNAAADAQTLYNIRQQMALSLKRMKDLEEQVKSIPELQLQLTQLRNEKQRLEQMMQRKEDELQRTRDIQRLSSSPSPNASPKYASPVQFMPQRISPISLESMGSRLRTNSTSSERQLKIKLKRDVGTMCAQHTTRDIAVGSPITHSRTVGTNPIHSLSLNEMLYTEQQLVQQVEQAVASYEQDRVLAQRKHCVSVGTQMYVLKPHVRDNGMQTAPEKQVLKFAMGITAKPSTRENFTSCKPDVRTVGCSDDRINAELCEKCAVARRSVGCSTDSVPLQALPNADTAVSLKLLDKRVPAIRKTVGTQYMPAVSLHTTGCQTVSIAVNSIGVQHVPQLNTTSTQSANIASSHRQTDTNDLLNLTTTKVKAEEVATPQPTVVPAKPQTRNFAANTDAPRTVDSGVNTMTPADISVRHAASNTEQLHKRDIGCGDTVKPHISIACADNYCDSCKDAIKHLAKDFTKITPAASPLPVRAVDSKIPRPKHLTSPSPVRKTFKRQNTYTISPTTTPTSASATPSTSPEGEKKIALSSLHEQQTPAPAPAPAPSSSPSGSFYQSKSTAAAENFTTEPQSSNSLLQRLARDGNELTKVADNSDVLIVKEQTRVSISWSRDASPAPLTTATTAGAVPARADLKPESLENALNDKLTAAIARVDCDAATAEEKSKGARRKSTSPQKPSQNTATAVATDNAAAASEQLESPPSKALLQKLAMVEATPREKIKPPKEMLTALRVINDSLVKKLGAKPFSSASLKSSKATIQQEWFRISSTDKANPHEVEDYLDCFENYSVPMLEYCVNMADNNGNTAMHYAVSHANFDIVSILLDSKVCNVNQTNNAGYTCVMLVSLAKLKNAAHRTVVERLFQMADVNIRAKKHCQTALMLAVSHGNSDMVEMLLAAGADINIQDEDGSTALMCAAEHGRIDIVKHLLSQAECDSLVQDIDGSTAFKIAWQAGHRDVGLLLYVHEQMLRSKLPNRGEPSLQQRSTTVSPKQHKRQPSK